MTKMRDHNIDKLRACGLALIMLAHVLPPPLILNLRCFDVPLMVFVSGLTCYKKDIPISFYYIWHRFKRLIIPVWVFLFIYFGAIICVQSWGEIDLGITSSYIIASFLFQGDVPFLWIIRVFLLISILTPYLQLLNKKISSNNLFSILVLTSFGVYSFFAYNRVFMYNGFVRDYLYYSMGYGLVFLIGLRIKDYKQSAKLIPIPLVFFTVLFFLNMIKYIAWGGK